jgi:hypothetical protein
MNSGQRNEPAGRGVGGRTLVPEPPRTFVQPTLPCSTRSAELLLVFLILISLNIVAAYDWLLSRILKIGRGFPGTHSSNGFDTTHLSRSVARRIRPGV